MSVRYRTSNQRSPSSISRKKKKSKITFDDLSPPLGRIAPPPDTSYGYSLRDLRADELRDQLSKKNALQIHLPTREPVKMDSSFWGFPVYFSSKEDSAKREKLKDDETSTRELVLMSEEDALASSIRNYELGVAQKKDYDMYILLVTKYGPLDNEKFCLGTRYVFFLTQFSL